MARRYDIELNYKATITISVEGDFHDEGEALDKAMNIAEEADINEFNIGEQLESKIVHVS